LEKNIFPRGRSPYWGVLRKGELEERRSPFKEKKREDRHLAKKGEAGFFEGEKVAIREGFLSLFKEGVYFPTGGTRLMVVLPKNSVG